MPPELIDLRPRMHRYCARIMGSAFDGEDVVQDAYMKAAAALAGGATIDQPERWMLRIAHNAALDALRRRGREPIEAVDEAIPSADTADSRVAANAALAAFLPLAPVQRAAVALADVLGHSAEEVAQILETSVPAVKAALHRGRARLRVVASEPVRLDPAERARLDAYAARFNARDWDALRALLAEDVRLDLANRVAMRGAKDVGVYFARYSEAQAWHLEPGIAEGRLALLARDPAAMEEVAFVILLDWRDGRIAAIRDFHYARYVGEALDIAALT